MRIEEYKFTIASIPVRSARSEDSSDRTLSRVASGSVSFCRSSSGKGERKLKLENEKTLQASDGGFDISPGQ
jgi:hypothetical protein